jgi:hypothetical protein
MPSTVMSDVSAKVCEGQGFRGLLPYYYPTTLEEPGTGLDLTKLVLLERCGTK